MVPLSTSCRMVCHMSVRLLGSRPVVGSSKKTIGASPTRLMAMSSRRRIPPEKVSRRRSAASPRSNLSSRSAAVCRGSATVAQLAHQQQVLAGGEHVVDRGELSGQADLLADLGGLLGDVEPGDARRAPVGVEQRGQDVDRGRLARAVAPSRAKTVPRPTLNDTSWSTGTPCMPSRGSLTSMAVLVMIDAPQRLRATMLPRSVVAWMCRSAAAPSVFFSAL